jgi:hypothetical protein
MPARISLIAVPAILLLVLAACDADVGGGGGGGSANQGGGGGSNQGGGGAGGSNQGGGGTGGCPEFQPEHGSACKSDISCDYPTMHAQCGMTPLTVLASCSEGAWKVLFPATCAPLPPDAACSPLGHYIVQETGPYEPPDPLVDPYDGPFDLILTEGPGGLVYVEGNNSRLTSNGCSLKGGMTLDKDCVAMDGQMFCTYISRTFDLSFTSAPATGTVTIACTGECGFGSTAPAEAVKQP